MPYSPLGGYSPQPPMGAGMQAAAMGVQNPMLQQQMAMQMAGRPTSPPPMMPPQPQGGGSMMPPVAPWIQSLAQQGPQQMGIGSLQHMAAGGMVRPMASHISVPAPRPYGVDIGRTMYDAGRAYHAARKP